MNIENNNFYLFSGEFYNPDLPLEFTFIKKLKARNASRGREAALIKKIINTTNYPYPYLVLVPRIPNESMYNIVHEHHSITTLIAPIGSPINAPANASELASKNNVTIGASKQQRLYSAGLKT